MRLIAFFALLGCVAAAPDYDVVVVGGTPAGVAAALAAGRLGYTVALVEQTPALGGLLSSGVSRADDAVIQSNSGVFEEFRRRVESYHLTVLKNDPVVREHVEKPRVRHSVARGQAWEPKTAARIYAEMVAEVPRIQTFFRQVPVEAIVESETVRGVVTRDPGGRTYRYTGKIVIDATYEGDVAAFAAVPFRMGREPRSPEEPHAGHIFTDAFCEGVTALPGTIFPGGTGKGDHRIMAYNFRFVVKDYGRPDHPHRLTSPPPGYDPSRYKWRAGQKPYLPNGKIDVLGINWGNDWAGPSYRYPTASWEERAKIEEEYRRHALGYLYYIQTEGGSPNFGLADDEFTDNGNFPYRLYVREARRIEGLYTLSESDIHKDLRGNGHRGPLQRDAIAIGIYEIDSHNVQNPTDREKPCSGEGAINLVDITGPYQIPYGVMVPRSRRGLLVPVAISSTHVAISTVRMEPVWSALGHAAGVAAALAIESGKDLRDISVPRIQQLLLKQGSKLFFYMDVGADSGGFNAIQEMSLLDAIDGDENYYFRPDSAITLGDFARLAVRGLEIPLSITAAHFKDVPRSHPAFRYVESLYDLSSQSEKPFLEYEVRDYLNYRSLRDASAFVYPNRPVDLRAAARILAGLAQQPEGALTKMGALSQEQLSRPDQVIRRGEACRIVLALRTHLRRITASAP